VIWQRNEKRHYRAHYEELAARFEMEERYRVTLKSIGDGVIVTDPEGKITLMNDVAQTMTGWKEEEALGHPVHEVFNIVNEYSREPVENPILNVLKKGKVVGLANHTLLIARDGKEYPIADSGAPIKNENGNIIGVVLIFRDQTKERAAQAAIKRNEALLRLIFHTNPDSTSLNRLEDGVYVSINENFITWTGYTREDVIGKQLKNWASGRIGRPFVALRDK